MVEGVAGATIRVVRCPKCEKLLPELPSYSIYLCGGCGTALEARKEIPVSHVHSERSNAESIEYLDIFRSGPFGEASTEIDRQSERIGSSIGEGTSRGAALVSGRNSESGNEDNGFLNDPSTSNFDGVLRDKSIVRRKNSNQSFSRAPGVNRSTVIDQLVEGKTCNDGGQVDQQMHLQKGEERDGGKQLASYPDEGPSDYHAGSRYRHDDSENVIGQNSERLNGVPYLGSNQLEIMRVLSEVRDRISAVSSSPSPSDQANWPNPGISVMNRDYSLRSSLTLSRVPYSPQRQHQQGQLHNFIFKQLDLDPGMSSNTKLMPVQVALTILNNPSVPHLMNIRHPMGGPVSFGAEIFDRLSQNDRLHSDEPQTHQRIKFRERPRRSCQPIAGAAPFSICNNCYELLQLPPKSSLLEKNQVKMRCGSCSHAITLELNGGRLDNSAPAPVSDVSSEDNYDSNGNNPEAGIPSIAENSFSIHNNVVLVKEQELTSNETDKEHCLSPSCSMSEKVENPDSFISEKDDNCRSTELPAEAEDISHVSSVPLRDSSSDHVTDESRKEIRHCHSDQEKIVLLSENFKQNSTKDVSAATELDVFADKYLNRGFSQDLSNTGKNEDRPRTVKGGDSKFLTHLLSRFNHSMGSRTVKFFVNGYPISDRVAKKVEKQAGPIYPGEYWYDYHAGFWGVMGHPCCGIIPPFIDGLKYPMPKNCAAGNTGVFVNGRELNEKDLDLLVDRGLPDTPGRSYRIEASGKVWDEPSGEELDSLGNLAPNIERMKRGLGMRIPRVAT
ncbi:uncharacterized protein [Typha angustifolia]|uniref:uncharacterized protein n=1 Tax=Typha angustifolia TaxID=59011 RepID=UPI003C303BB5